MPQFGKVAIVGPGLIGGSIGLALKQRGLAELVVGVVRSAPSAERATAAGVVDATTLELAAGAQGAELVVACVPVGDIPAVLAKAAEVCPSGALLTDAGSTKARIVRLAEEAAARRGEGMAFVGSHPLAGDHRAGPESARADLLEGRTVVVTPTERTPPDALARTREFWTSLGGRVLTMSPEEHDLGLARTSHLPHLMASALAGMTPEELLPLAGAGWSDTTRVAAGSAALWRDIFVDNREGVLAALGDLENRLAEFRGALEAGDADTIQRLLAEGKHRRDALGS